MAKKYKLTKNGETIYPCSTTDAIVNPNTKKTVTEDFYLLAAKSIINTCVIGGGSIFLIKSAYWKIDGSLVVDSNYPNNICTPYIPFKKGDEITAYNTKKSAQSNNCNFYDSDLQFISGISLGSSVSELIINKNNTPDNSCYITLNGGISESTYAELNLKSSGILKTIDENTKLLQYVYEKTENLTSFIEKNSGILKDDGSIDNREESFHTNIIEVKTGDKITYYSRVSYGNNTAGTIVLMNANKEITGHYTPGSAVPLPGIYTVVDGTNYIVVNSFEREASLPLVNGISIGLKETVLNNTKTINEISSNIEIVNEEIKSYTNVYIQNNKSLSKTLGTYRSDAGYSISYPIPCKSGDIFSMSGFVAGTIANAWLLDENLNPIYVLSAATNQIEDNKWLNRIIPTVSGHTVSYIIACRKDSIDPDNYFIINGEPIAYFQYLDYLKNKGLAKGLQLDCDENGVNTINIVSNNGKLGDMVPIGGLSCKKSIMR